MSLAEILNAISKVRLLACEDEKDLWSSFTAQNRAQLILAYQPLVAGILRRIAPSEAHIEDCLSEGLLALIRAVDKYKYETGVAFSVFARIRIKGAIIDYLRKSSRDTLGEEAADFALFGELYDQGGLSELEQDKLAGILSMVEELDLKERAVIKMTYIEDITRGEIAESLGLTQARISQIHARAIKRLRGKIYSQKREAALRYVK
jgi:RNA polymerase sigma factor (sigma-70 family)